MKSRKTISAIVIAAMLILREGISVSAAVPDYVDSNPTWGDAWEIMDCVGEEAYNPIEEDAIWYWGEEDATVEELEAELPYLEPHTYILARYEVAYAALLEREDSYWVTESEGKEATDSVDADEYNALYTAAADFVGSIRIGKGEMYTYDLDEQLNELWEYTAYVDAQMQEEKIRIIEQDVEMPDVSEVEKGICFVSQEAADAYFKAQDTAAATEQAWNKDNLWGDETTRREIPREDFLEHLESFAAATKAFQDALKTGAKEKDGWSTEEGKEYWYEDGVKQGLDGRGKEIYDPDSKAWYWLDAPDGVKAVSKDVYQESLAGAWGSYTGEDGERYGKWVRYDESGHMIKGWQITDTGTYFFDNTYGTMAKGSVVIGGVEYYFDEVTGIKK